MMTIDDLRLYTFDIETIYGGAYYQPYPECVLARNLVPEKPKCSKLFDSLLKRFVQI